MPVEYRTGDLFAQPDIRALAHGCNTAGAMGKGIAVLFKQRWPAMYDEYRARCADGRFAPGDVFVWEAGGVTVFNLGTEKHWRTGATLEAIERSLTVMVREAERLTLDAVAMPRIGAGYGGLPWDVVRGVIERVAATTAVRLVVVSLPTTPRAST
jgi:O-acetyl-ADP-ribose deacetylase (regulator of RNase III)